MTGRTLRIAATLPALLALAAAPPPREDKPPLPTVERALAQAGRKLVNYLQDKRYKNVGVLAFQVEGSRAVTLGLRLSRQVELALLLRNNPSNPLGVLRDASAVARATPRTDYRNKYGRLKLFSLRYPLAWGDAAVEADAFLTGRAVIAGDLETIAISFDVFDARDARLTPLPEDLTLQARMDADKLGEIGESYLVTGDADGEPAERERKLHRLAIRSARAARQARRDHPMFAASPVTLQILYDGKEPPMESRDGQVFVPPPASGQTVELVLTRDGSREPYGCVLKVDGVSTLDKEPLPDLECRLRLLRHGDAARVASPPLTARPGAGDEPALYAGPAGTISLTVYRLRRGDPALPDVDDRDGDRETVLQMARYPAGTFESPEALRAAFDAWFNTSRSAGGMILRGSLAGNKHFPAEAVPVQGLTVHVAARR
jgi:hypothetical protein